MKTKVTRAPDGHRDVLAWTTNPAELDRWVQAAAQSGQLVGSMRRQRDDGVWELAARLHSEPYPRHRQQLPASHAPYRTVRRAQWTLRLPPEVPRWLVVAAAAVGALVALVWLAAHAIRGAGQWASDQAAWLTLAALLLLIGGGLWLARPRKSTKAGAARGCAGVAHHCSGCPDH